MSIMNIKQCKVSIIQMRPIKMALRKNEVSVSTVWSCCLDLLVEYFIRQSLCLFLRQYCPLKKELYMKSLYAETMEIWKT